MKNKVVLLHGGAPELISAIADVLLAREVTLVLYGQEQNSGNVEIVQRHQNSVGNVVNLQHDNDDTDGVLRSVFDTYGGIDAMVNLFVPTPTTTSEVFVRYTSDLEKRVVSAASFMAEHATQGIIINQFMLATVFADHPLGYSAAAARGAVTGITRTACVRFGKAGVRVAGLFVGLLDIPEIKAIATERVLKANTPIGRWISATDVAETVNFLALDSGYITGQMLVLDGGMTSGINGV